jgi:hypothetical protein
MLGWEQGGHPTHRFQAIPGLSGLVRFRSGLLRHFGRINRHARFLLPISYYRSCRCGAVYSRTEAMAPSRQIASFECSVCGATIGSWNTAWVPTYRLIAGPVRLPRTSN